MGDTHLVDQNVLGTTLAAVMADVVRMEEVGTSPVPMCGLLGAATESTQQCNDTPGADIVKVPESVLAVVVVNALLDVVHKNASTTLSRSNR